jgi:hypothetical protein
MMNFGIHGNGQMCDCGLHEGVGELSPGDRAARYKHMLLTLRPYVTAEQLAYLESWEKHHGTVSYVMEFTTVQSDGTYSAKGERRIKVAKITSWHPNHHHGTHRHGGGWHDQF